MLEESVFYRCLKSVLVGKTRSDNHGRNEHTFFIKNLSKLFKLFFHQKPFKIVKNAFETDSGQKFAKKIFFRMSPLYLNYNQYYDNFKIDNFQNVFLFVRYSGGGKTESLTSLLHNFMCIFFI